MQTACDLFQSGCEIDGRTDAGEIEPVAAPYIAVEHPSDVQGDAKAETLDGLADRKLQRLDIGARFARGVQHTFTDLPHVLADRKNGQQSVTHIFQDLA